MSGGAQFKDAAEAFQRGDLDRALALAEDAVGSAPSPQWQHLLGLIHCRLGQPEAGVDHLRAAAEAEPGNPAFQVMLARALVDAGRVEELLAIPEPPPPTSPATLALWQSRAEAADLAGKVDLSVRAWSAVMAAAPQDWRAWGNLGNALARQQRLPEAADALAEAARLNRTEPAVRADAVAALAKAGAQHQALLQFDEAEAAFRRAYALDPTDRSIVHQLGVALERTNRLEELAKLLDDASAAGIGKQELGYLWAILARREGKLEEARDLLAGADPAADPVAWNALRAKIADALGDSEQAFEAAAAMNQAAIDRSVRAEDRDEWSRRTSAYREEQRELAGTITPEWAAKVPLLAEPPRQRVAFLLGFPRSGTTLLDTFLLGHPEIAVLEEQQLVGAAAQVTGPIEDLPTVSKAKLKQARATYCDRLVEHVGAGFTGLPIDKFPLDMASAPLIQAMFPGAPILFMQRHPCDVVLSGFMQSFGLVNFSEIADAAEYYDALMRIWTASRETMALNVHDVVYEELVGDPEAVLKPAIAFLGLEWDDRILDHQRTAKARGTIQTPSYDQVTEPVTARASGRWKRYTKQLEPVLPILLPWAERLGYRD